MIKRSTFGFAALIFIVSLNFSGCKSRSSQDKEPEKSESVQNEAVPVQKQEAYALGKVIFFIENSGSMAGYVNQANEFKNSLVGLAYLPEFDKADKGFYFINGTSDPSKKSGIQINLIGNDPEFLKNKLNPKSFKVGDIRFSDLNKMFEIALDSAKDNQISILVSDCIYDVGNDQDPLTALNIEIQKTQQAFRNRLESEDLQTLIIKAISRFDGQYYYASKAGSRQLAGQERPFYLVIFGKSGLLNKMLTEKSIGSKITGPFQTARFFVNDERNIPFQIAPSENVKGEFMQDYENKFKLKNAKSLMGEFQFAFAADFNSLPFSDSYLTNISNYNCHNPNFNVITAARITKKIAGVNGTHLITVFTNKNPAGNLEVVLKNVTPGWVMETDIDNEDYIDNSHTYGFQSLTDAISKAYEYKNDGKNPATFKIMITK